MTAKSWSAWAGLLLLLLLWGCATTGGRAKELLAMDYTTMSDEELRTYYHQLNDQIARVERAARPPRVVAGAGGSPEPEGANAGAGGAIAEDLRERRNEVRSELGRRKIPPYQERTGNQ